jgi:glutamate-1-semialdehyde 2,1-aminomutase
MPVGAFGGKREIIAHLAPQGPVYQAGTLSGNPVAMAAGLANLRDPRAENAWGASRRSAPGSRRAWRRAGAVAGAGGWCALGSLFWLSLQAGGRRAAPTCIDGGAAGRSTRKLFHALLARGVAMAPSAYEVGFLSLAHGEEHLQRLAAALGEALAEAG